MREIYSKNNQCFCVIFISRLLLLKDFLFLKGRVPDWMFKTIYATTKLLLRLCTGRDLRVDTIYSIFIPFLQRKSYGALKSRINGTLSTKCRLIFIKVMPNNEIMCVCVCGDVGVVIYQGFLSDSINKFEQNALNFFVCASDGVVRELCIWSGT